MHDCSNPPNHVCEAPSGPTDRDLLYSLLMAMRKLATESTSEIIADRVNRPALDGVFAQLPTGDWGPPTPCRGLCYILISGTFTINGATYDATANGPVSIPFGGDGGDLYAPRINSALGAVGFATYHVVD